jgi:hypothetical protein
VYAPGADWPSYAGPGPAHAAKPCGNKLVDTFEPLRIVWKSEDWFDGGCGTTVRYGPMGADIEWPINNGGGSPVFADGRIYCAAYLPSGKVYDKAKV